MIKNFKYNRYLIDVNKNSINLFIIIFFWKIIVIIE